MYVLLLPCIALNLDERPCSVQLRLKHSTDNRAQTRAECLPCLLDSWMYPHHMRRREKYAQGEALHASRQAIVFACAWQLTGQCFETGICALHWSFMRSIHPPAAFPTLEKRSAPFLFADGGAHAAERARSTMQALWAVPLDNAQPGSPGTDERDNRQIVVAISPAARSGNFARFQVSGLRL